MKAMLSTFRTAPTDLLQHESQTTPVHLSLEYQVLKSSKRMQTAPPNHPIYPRIQCARLQHQTSLTHTSVLEHLATKFPQYAGLRNMTPVETIYLYIVPPWWEKPYRICISAMKDSAEEQHWEAAESNLNNPNLLEVSTDGSGIEGQIGAAYTHQKPLPRHTNISPRHDSKCLYRQTNSHQTGCSNILQPSRPQSHELLYLCRQPGSPQSTRQTQKTIRTIHYR
jgi:hypothetical protein